jgi:hypothetical protein
MLMSTPMRRGAVVFCALDLADVSMTPPITRE